MREFKKNVIFSSSLLSRLVTVSLAAALAACSPSPPERACATRAEREKQPARWAMIKGLLNGNHLDRVETPDGHTAVAWVNQSLIEADGKSRHTSLRVLWEFYCIEKGAETLIIRRADNGERLGEYTERGLEWSR